jgi:hypothetical protein
MELWAGEPLVCKTCGLEKCPRVVLNESGDSEMASWQG